jgi:hypothetical protein
VASETYHLFRFSKPQRFITVRILARGHGEWRETPVEIVWGEVRVGEELNRFQGIMKDRFYTCYAIGTLTLFIVNSVLLFIGAMLLKERRRLRQEETARALEETFEEDDHDDGPPGGAFDSQREGEWGDQGDDWDDLPTNQEQAAQESDLHVIPETNDQGLDDNATNDANVSEAPQNIAERDSTAGSESGRTQPEVSDLEEEDYITDRDMRGHTDPFVVFTGEGMIVSCNCCASNGPMFHSVLTFSVSFLVLSSRRPRFVKRREPLTTTS